MKIHFLKTLDIVLSEPLKKNVFVIITEIYILNIKMTRIHDIKINNESNIRYLFNNFLVLEEMSFISKLLRHRIDIHFYTRGGHTIFWQIKDANEQEINKFRRQ